MLNVLILPILTILLISGCQSTRTLEIFTKEVERIPLAIELPPVELMEEINYLIINEANQEEVFAKLKEANIDPVLFGLTDEPLLEEKYIFPVLGPKDLLCGV